MNRNKEFSKYEPSIPISQFFIKSDTIKPPAHVSYILCHK